MSACLNFRRFLVKVFIIHHICPGIPGKPGEAGPAGPPGQKGEPGGSTGGVVYPRWGRKHCPSGTTELYSGTKSKSSLGTFKIHRAMYYLFHTRQRDIEKLRYRSRDHFAPKICFQNGDVFKSGKPIFVFVQRKKHVFVEKIKILQHNSKMMPRCSLNSDNMM
jgi:hypothetical protein